MGTARQIEVQVIADGTAINGTATAQSRVIDIRRLVPQNFMIKMSGSPDVKIEYAVSNGGETPVASAFGDNADIVSNMTTAGRFVRLAAPAINSPYMAILVTGNAGNGGSGVAIDEFSLWASEAE